MTEDEMSLFDPTRRRFQVVPAEILENLRLFSNAIGNRPATRQEYKHWPHKIVSPDVIYRMFGSWEDACRQAGIPLPKKKDMYSEQELIEHFEKLWRYLGQRPSIGQFKAYNHKFGTTITHDAYVRRWGSFPDFCHKFGKYKMGLLSFNELVERVKRNPRVGISERLRAEILARDNHTCRDCGASPRKEPNVTLHIHHVIPVSRGGKTEANNLVTNCRACNQGKSDVILDTEEV